jgi:tetratricopeptide (TPR) repeat protein
MREYARVALVFAFGLTTLLGCRAPGAKLRPHEILHQGDELYREGRLPEAEEKYRLALTKAEKAELELAFKAKYLDRLMQVCAEQGKLGDAQRYLEQAGVAAENFAPRAFNNFGVVAFRHNKLEEADEWLTRAAQALEGDGIRNYSYFEGTVGPALFLVRANLDRVRSARGRLEEANQLFRVSFSDLGRQWGGPRELPPLPPRLRPSRARHMPLPEPLRAPAARYGAFLRSSQRPDQGDLLAERIREIDGDGPASEAAPEPCVVYGREPPMECLLEAGLAAGNAAP